MSAVPSDAPRFWAVPCRPPASLVCAGGAADMITLPSCDASRPAPIAEDGQPDREADAVELDIERADEDHDRTQGHRETSPTWHDRSRRPPGRQRGPAQRGDEHRRPTSG